MGKAYQRGVSESFGFDRNLLPVVEAVARVASRLWPVKTARHLASRTRVTHRAAESWLGHHTGMSGDALADLLRSDAGLEVLKALMPDAPPSWWPVFRADCQSQALEKRLDALKTEIEEARREANT